MTVFGGPHPSVLSRDVAAQAAVDAVVVGEGERSFLDLCRRVKAGDRDPSAFLDVPNLVLRDESGAIHSTNEVELLGDRELDALP